MRIQVSRVQCDSACTIGQLSVDGVPQCYSLEDVVREVPGEPVASWKIFGKTAIPRGLYRVVITPSAHFGRDLPELLDVPGFSGVRIHPGNVAADTEGCILVGMDKGADSIGRSRIAFDALFPKIQAAIAANDEVWIQVA
jgi:hypothetical protein